MISVLGHEVEVVETTQDNKQCKRSTDDHLLLKQEARADRQKHPVWKDHVDDSYVICGKCGKAISLKV